MNQYGTIQLITFQLMEEEFGIDILRVEEIQRLKEISLTKVPQSEEYIEGVVNLRGNVIPVVDLRKRFEMGEHKVDKETRIIVVNLQERPLGFLVDRVNEVINVEKDSIDAPPQEIAKINSSLIQGIVRHGERLVIMLDIENIVTAVDEVMEMVEE